MDALKLYLDEDVSPDLARVLLRRVSAEEMQNRFDWLQSYRE